MTIEFIEEIKEYTDLKPILISGSASAKYAGHKYLVLKEDGNVKGIYEVRYQVHCSPFNEALLVGHLLAVGHEEHFYLFDREKNENLLNLEMNGYFGHLYFESGLFYVADAFGLHCIDKTGNILWSNLGLAIDGVIVNQFTNSKIFGIGELDPPGVWNDFSLDRLTGIRLK